MRKLHSYSKLFYPFLLVLVSGLAANASADPYPIGFYEFEGNYLDSSGYGNHGVPKGNAQIVVDSARGLVLDVHAEDQQPTVFGYVDLGLGAGEPNFAGIDGGISIMAWIKVSSFSTTNIPGDNEWEGIVTKGHDWRLHREGFEDPDYDMRFTADGLSVHTMYPEDGTAVWDGRWHHVAGVYDPNYYGDGSGRVMLYIDGELDKAADCTGTITNLPSRTVWIGGQSDANTPGSHTRYFDGLIDDVRIYNCAIPAPCIPPLPPPPLYAHYPHPTHKITVAGDDRESLELSWTPGRFADKHNVYFGTGPEALVEVAHEQKPAEYTLVAPFSPLDLDTTYYWQVDEVNNAHQGSPWPGSVWEFTVGNYLTVDDFADYDIYVAGGGVGYSPSTVVWAVAGSAYVYLELTECYETPQSMKINYYNSWDPYYSGAKHTFGSPHDWSPAIIRNIRALDVAFRGSTSNDPGEELYVKLSDNTITRKLTCTPDLTSEAWQVWHIDLADFSAQGIVLSNITAIEVGLGDGVDPGVVTTGDVYIDDIRLYVPRDKCVLFPDLRPAGDFTGPEGEPDCVVDNWDLKIMTDEWLTSGIKADLFEDNNVDFKDFAILAQDWLVSPLWPSP